MRTILATASACLLLASAASAQMQSSSAYTTTDDLSDVRLFLGWIPDATFTRGVDVEPWLRWGNYDRLSTISAGALAGVWVNEDLEVGGRWGFTSFDHDDFGEESGLNDLTLYGRYRLPLEVDPVVAVGGEFTLPVGDDDIGQGNFDFHVFGAMRYDVEGAVTLTAHAGIESVDRRDREAGIRLGGGVIAPMTEELALVAELSLTTAYDWAAVLAGVDYELPPGGHLRAALALGLDDAAPDVELLLGFSIPVY